MVDRVEVLRVGAWALGCNSGIGALNMTCGGMGLFGSHLEIRGEKAAPLESGRSDSRPGERDGEFAEVFDLH